MHFVVGFLNMYIIFMIVKSKISAPIVTVRTAVLMLVLSKRHVANITLLPQHTFFIKWPKTQMIYCTNITACILTGARKKGFWHCCTGHLAFRIGFKLHYAFLFKKNFPAIEYILERLMKNVSICVFISCVSNICKAVSLEICQGRLGKKRNKKLFKTIF